MKNIVIELNKKATDKFLENLDSHLDNKLEKQKTTLIMDNFLESKENIIEDILGKSESVKNMSSEELERNMNNLNKTVEQYLEKSLRLMVEIDDEKISFMLVNTFTIKGNANQSTVIVFTIDHRLPFYPIIIEHDYASKEHATIVAIKLQKFFYTVMNYMDKPSETITTTTTKVKKNSSKTSKKKSNKSNVRYVYKTIHKISDYKPSKTVKKDSDNNTERNRLKSEWGRKGHYRHYYDKETNELKKRVWVKESTCKAKSNTTENHQLKITRVD